MTQKTKKVMEIWDNAIHYVVIKHLDTNRNPYKVYRLYYESGWHRIKINEFQDLLSCQYFLIDTIRG